MNNRERVNVSEKYPIVLIILFVALFVVEALGHIFYDRAFLSWELVVVLVIATLPILLPLMRRYIKNIGKDGMGFWPEDQEVTHVDKPSRNEGPNSSRIDEEQLQHLREYAEEAKRVDGFMLVHVYRPSLYEKGVFNVYMFLVQEGKGSDETPRRRFDTDKIKKVEFFLGEAWGNRTFSVGNIGGILGIRCYSQKSFLASCRIIFSDDTKEAVTVYRYVDFHMLQDIPDEN